QCPVRPCGTVRYRGTLPVNDPVLVNGLPLPPSLIEAVRTGRWRTPPDSRPSPRLVCYGSFERMEAETRRVQGFIFPRPATSNYSNPAGVSREFDPSNIACIGDTDIDEPICMNYWGTLDPPRVVYLELPNPALNYWRVIAPDFESLLASVAAL